MTLKTTFMFHYQLNQNTGCKIKFVVNMNRQPKRLSKRRHRRWSEQPFYSRFAVHLWVTCGCKNRAWDCLTSSRKNGQ